MMNLIEDRNRIQTDIQACANPELRETAVSQKEVDPEKNPKNNESMDIQNRN